MSGRRFTSIILRVRLEYGYASNGISASLCSDGSLNMNYDTKILSIRVVTSLLFITGCVALVLLYDFKGEYRPLLVMLSGCGIICGFLNFFKDDELGIKMD